MKIRFHLYLERLDPGRNMQRFYALSLEPTLFGDLAVVRRWGRIGTLGRSRLALCRTEAEAVALFLDMARRKIRRNYRPPQRAANALDPAEATRAGEGRWTGSGADIFSSGLQKKSFEDRTASW